MSWFNRKKINPPVSSSLADGSPAAELSGAQPVSSVAGIFAKDSPIKPKLARREVDRKLSGKLGLGGLFRSKKNAGRRVVFALKPEQLETVAKGDYVVLGGDLVYCDLSAESPGDEYVAQVTPRRGQGLLSLGDSVNVYVWLHQKVIEKMAEDLQFKPVLGMDCLLQIVHREAKHKILIAVYADGENTCFHIVTTGASGRINTLVERRNQPDPVKRPAQFAQELRSFVEETKQHSADPSKTEIIIIGDIQSTEDYAGMTLLGTTPFFSKKIPPLDSGFKRINPWAYILPVFALLVSLGLYSGLIFWHKQQYNKAVAEFKAEGLGIAELRKTGNGETLEVLTQWKNIIEREEPQLTAAKELPALLSRIAEVPNARITQFSHRFGSETVTPDTKGPDDFTVVFNVPANTAIPIVEQGNALIKDLSAKTGLEMALVPVGYSESASVDKPVGSKRRSYTVKGGRRGAIQ